MKHTTKSLTILILCISILFPVFGQEDTTQLSDDIFNYSLKELMELKVISASKIEEANTLAPATVYVITEQSIISNGHLNLVDVLENVPGITVHNPDFFIWGGQRGYLSNFSNTLIMINGREMQNLIAAETFINTQFATHNIKRIEVLQGPASSLYGANALSGIINIITKSNDPEFEGISMQIDGGTQNTRAISMVVGKNVGDIRISGSFRYFYTDGWDFDDFMKDAKRCTEGFPDIVNNKNDTVCYWNQNKAIPISAKISYKDFYVGMERYHHEINSGQHWVSLDPNSQRDNRDLALYYAGYNHEFKNDFGSIEAEYQYTNEHYWGRFFEFVPEVFDEMVTNGRDPNQPLTSREIHENFTQVYSAENSEGSHRHRLNLLLNLRLKYKTDMIFGYTLDNIDVIAGGNNDHDWVPYVNTNISDDNPNRRPFYENTKHSFYLQAKKPFFDEGLHLTFGARYDHHTLYEGVTTIRTGLVFKPMKKTYIKALFGQGFREPTVFEYGAHQASHEANNLVPTKLNAYELSFNRMFGENINFMVCAYQNNITDRILPHASMTWYNEPSKYTIYGIESQLRVKTKSLAATLNHTYTQSKNVTIGNATAQSLNNYPHRLNLSLTYTPWKYIQLNTGINYYSDVDCVHGNYMYNDEKFLTIGSFTNVNANLIVRNIHIENASCKLIFSISNLTNGNFYQPNVRRTGIKQLMLPGRQFFVRFIFDCTGIK